MKTNFWQVAIFLFCLFLVNGCKPKTDRDFGILEFKSMLPFSLREVSGIQYDPNEDAFWMINDSGNSSAVYLVDESGTILRKLKIDAKNRDWEDLALDKDGNLYIGDFGNNANDRKNLRIFKIKKKDLKKEKKIKVKKIEFRFPEQKEFPPKRMYYDVEAFFIWNDNFYIFTKSRVDGQIGRTFMYKVPNKKGKHDAKRVSEFTTCLEDYCWVTGADISQDGKKMTLLSNRSAWVFSDYKEEDFFNGKAKEYNFEYLSQIESVSFKDNETLYIADEENKRKRKGRLLYTLSIKE